jgi:hypothetical protein
MIRATCSLGLLNLVLLAACHQSDTPHSVAFTVRDSAGIRIAETGRLDGIPPLNWHVDSAAALRIGGDQADASPLYKVMAATRLSDGRVAVASAGTHELRFYSSAGRLLRSIGRAGDGPGEFRSLFWVGRLPGDSLATWDVSPQRLSLFTPGGDFVRAVTSRSPLGIFPLARGVVGDGRVLIAASGGTPALDVTGRTSTRGSDTYLLLRPSDGAADTLGEFPGTEQIALAGADGGFLMRPLPFGRTTLAAVHDSLIYVADSDRFEIRVFSLRGHLVGLIRAAQAPVPVTAEDIAAYRRTLVTLGAEGDREAERREQRLLDAAPYPATMPAYIALKVDSEGDIWVQAPQRPGSTDGSLWTVFTPDGRPRGTVRLPPGLHVHEIGRNWVVGVEVDSDEVEHVRMFPLVREP